MKLGNRTWKESSHDGVIQTDLAYQAHEGKLYVETHQPNKRQILEQAQRMRSVSNLHTQLKRGVRIPEDDFPAVVTRWPNIVRGTNEERQQALTAIMQAHPEWITIEHRRKFY